jgi:hypothetical protein
MASPPVDDLGPSGTRRDPARYRAATAAVVAAAAVGLLARFVTSSPLWLDEALSVNIAGLPLGDIPGTLRRDGHPPLFYLLLHGWMRQVGTTDDLVRAFSGVWAVALLPLTWVAAARVGGRRAAGCAVVILALSPYAVRYGTEARMYAMVSVLALAGWLLADAAWRRPALAPTVGVAACASLLLWTHYWALLFLAVAGGLLIVVALRAHRAADRARRGAALRLLVALAAAGLSFGPWVPSLWYQRVHTGTPWARASRPAELLSTLALDLGGGGTGEANALGWSMLVLAGVGAWLHCPRPWSLTMDLRSPRNAAAGGMAVLTAGTLVLGGVAGLVTGAAFASRYAAVVLPFVVVLAGLAVAEMRPRLLGVGTLVVISALAGLGVVRNATVARSDSRRNAEAIAAVARDGDLVVYCPDQAGPATARELGNDLEQVTFPTFGSPVLVDWVDYEARNAAVSPEAFAREVLTRAEGRTVFLVYSVAIHTHRETCPAVLEELARSRPAEVLTSASPAFEPAGVVRFAPPPDPPPGP